FIPPVRIETLLYSGCPSAKVMISGGRYDYTFDDHRRLVKAACASIETIL
ncbi:MAG: hypothetical protein HDT06_02930, partial [Bacteroidales bacterium]|nr:hypothetical protein [Bacteroidales bacterium]